MYFLRNVLRGIRLQFRTQLVIHTPVAFCTVLCTYVTMREGGKREGGREGGRE